MYEGTRIISITNESQKSGNGAEKNTRADRKNAARRPIMKQASGRNPGRLDSGGRRKMPAQERRRLPQSQANGLGQSVPQNVRMPSADSRERSVRMSSSHPYSSSAQPQGRAVSPASMPQQRRGAESSRRVLSRSQAVTGDFTAGVSVTGNTRSSTAPVSGRDGASRLRGDGAREHGRVQQTVVRGGRPVYAQSGYDTKPRYGAQSGSGARGGYNTQNAQPIGGGRGTQPGYNADRRNHLSGNERGENERSFRASGASASAHSTAVRDARGGGYHTGQMRGTSHDGMSRKPSDRYPQSSTSYGTSGGAARSGVRPYGDAYNKNPVYCYGNRTSAEAENGRRNTSDARRKSKAPTEKKKPRQKKLSPEEKSRIRAADSARKKAEKQIALERRKKKKVHNKARRGTRRAQRLAAAREFRTAFIRALVRSVPFIVLFFITFAISAGLFALSVFAALNINLSGLPDTVRYQIGEDEADDKITFELSSDRFIREGIVYMSMDDFAERFEYTAAGNSKEIKYISRTSDDVVKVTVGSSAAVVNGVRLRLTAPVLRDGDEILLPLDFFATYVTGFSVSYDAEEHKVTMIREITGYNVSVAEGKTPIYAAAGFKPSLMSSTENIAEGSLPSDILAATDPNPPAPETDESGNPVVDSGSGIPIG